MKFAVSFPSASFSFSFFFYFLAEMFSLFFVPLPSRGNFLGLSFLPLFGATFFLQSL